MKQQKENSHRWYLKHKEEKRQRDFDWRKENPGKVAAIQKRMYKKYSTMMHELKINGCAICGYDKCDYSLDFHHSNPKDKKFGLHIRNFTGRSIKDYTTELNKCVLLCRNCHGEITELERGN